MPELIKCKHSWFTGPSTPGTFMFVHDSPRNPAYQHMGIVVSCVDETSWILWQTVPSYVRMKKTAWEVIDYHLITISILPKLPTIQLP